MERSFSGMTAAHTSATPWSARNCSSHMVASVAYPTPHSRGSKTYAISAQSPYVVVSRRPTTLPSDVRRTRKFHQRSLRRFAGGPALTRSMRSRTESTDVASGPPMNRPTSGWSNAVNSSRASAGCTALMLSR
jgi:hypothetical protein